MCIWRLKQDMERFIPLLLPWLPRGWVGMELANDALCLKYAQTISEGHNIPSTVF